MINSQALTKKLPQIEKRFYLLKDYKLSPEVIFFGTKTKVEFNGSCLKQDKVIFNDG